MTAVIRRSVVLPSAVILWAIATATVVGYGVGNPLRSSLVLPFLFAGPGLALVPLLRIAGWGGLALSVGLSLALDALVPTAMIYAGAWSPDATLAILVAFSILGGTAQLALELLGSRRAVETAP